MEFTDEKVLHRSEHGEIALVTDTNGNEYIRKTGKFSADALSAISKIDSPYIAKIVSYSDSQVIMERISGKPLSEISVPQEQLYEVVCEICKGLRALHSAGVIHRDIKPSNIMLADDGHIKIIDFDAARVKKPEADKDTLFIGTDGFAPPEQYGFTQTDERSDIYALGVTIKLLLRDKYENSKFRTVAEKCMRFDPDKRYKSAEQVETALQFRQHKVSIIITSAVLFAIGVFIGVMIAKNTGKNIPVSEPVINIIETTTSASTDISTEPVTQISETIAATTTFASETFNNETYTEKTDIPAAATGPSETADTTMTHTTSETTTASETTTMLTTPETTTASETTTTLTTPETTTASETTTSAAQPETTAEISTTEEIVLSDISFVPEGFPELPQGISSVDDRKHIKKVIWEQLDKETAYDLVDSIKAWLGESALVEDNFTRLGRIVQWKCTDPALYNGHISMLYVEDTEKNSMFPQCQLSFSEIENG